MVLFHREGEDDEHLSVSTDSSATPTPDDMEDVAIVEDVPAKEHVTVVLEVGEDGELCKVQFSSETDEQVQEEPVPEESAETDIHVLIKGAQESLESLKIENAELQRRILGAHGRRRSIVDADMLEGQDILYQSNLTQWVTLKEELEQLQTKYHHDIKEMEDDLESMQAQAREHQEKLIEELFKIARESQHSVTGQILSDSVLFQLEERNRVATAELEKVRITGRQLLSHLRKLEQAKRKKDQLPGGLHLVDYEQLKMENESLAEKIHAKNEEISLMRKKRTVTVHSLSHVREKLQYVEKDTKVSNEKLEEVEKELHQGRITLHSLKSRCEHIRQKKSRLQKSMVNIVDPMLLDDLENLKEDAEVSEEIIGELRSRHEVLNEELRGQTSVAALGRLRMRPVSHPASDATETAKHAPRWGEMRKLVRLGRNPV